MLSGDAGCEASGEPVIARYQGIQFIIIMPRIRQPPNSKRLKPHIREVAKNWSFFSGPATKRGAWPLRKNNVF